MKQNKKAIFKNFSDFQLRVLEETLKIPFGRLRTYSWIARQIGCPKAARAVGSALRNNPWPLIIPCHRVVKSNGDTGGYSRGKAVKRNLIEFERMMKEIFCLKGKKEVS